MSGYGAYVWSCFGLTFAVLLYNGWSSRQQLREQIVRAKRRADIQTDMPNGGQS